MDVSTTSLRSTGSTGMKPRASRQVSSVSTKSQSSTGSPRMSRKAPLPAAATNGKTTQKSKTNGTASTPGRNDRVELLRPEVQDRRSSASSIKSKTEKSETGNRRPEKKAPATPTNPVTPKLVPKSAEVTRKTGTPKEAVVKRTARDVKKNTPGDKPLRSDSSDLEIAAKLVSMKIYQLRSDLVKNSSIVVSLKNFLQDGVENLVVLPLGRFSRNSQALWRAGMVEVLLEITVPRRRVFMDPSLIELEKESLKSHAFLHHGDAFPAEIEVKNSMRAPGITLFFAPLPELDKIEQMLEENEDRLEEILVIGYNLRQLAKKAPASSRLCKHLKSIQLVKFPFQMFPMSPIATVFADLRGHRFTPLAKSSSRISDMKASSCETLNESRGSDSEEVLKSAVSAPNLTSEASRVPTTLLTIGAICCGAGLAWMFINKR